MVRIPESVAIRSAWITHRLGLEAHIYDPVVNPKLVSELPVKTFTKERKI